MKKQLKEWFEKYKKVIIVGGCALGGIIAYVITQNGKKEVIHEVNDSVENEEESFVDGPVDLSALKNKRIWDLYECEEGQFMLQTEDSQYYDCENIKGEKRDFVIYDVTQTSFEKENEEEA